MNNFDEPVKKAETDAEILDALQGVKLTQDEIRRGACGGMGLAFFRAYYEKLPEEVARRLTEIDTEAVEHIHPGDGSQPVRLAPGSVRGEAGKRRRLRPGHPGGERVPGAAGLRSPRAGRLAGGGDMSERARKAGQFAGAVERLAVELAMVEIIQARRFLGKPTSKKDREELLKLTTPELASAAQALGAAVHLRQQMEIAEFTRGLIEQQKAAQEPQGGPLPC